METDCEGVDWIHLAQDKDQRRALWNGNEFSGYTNGREFLDQLKDSTPWSQLIRLRKTRVFGFFWNRTASLNCIRTNMHAYCCAPVYDKNGIPAVPFNFCLRMYALFHNSSTW
jgi:hypothetical protein